VGPADAVCREPYAARTVGAKGLFKRSLLGYRRGSVDEAIVALELELELRGHELTKRRAELEERDRRIALLDGVADDLAGLVVERDRELRDLRDELAVHRARQGAERHTRERVERELAELGAQARGQATRIRMQALRHAAQLAGQRVGPANGEAAPAGELEPGEAVSVERPAAEANGHARGGGLDRFEGLIHLEIGPLSDFSQLVRFEDAANRIGATSEISVKRFSRGRATLALRLAEPVELLRELEERAPFEFRVRSLRDDRLIIDVGDE
jgi:phage shock protein A